MGGALHRSLSGAPRASLRAPPLATLVDRAGGQRSGARGEPGLGGSLVLYDRRYGTLVVPSARRSAGVRGCPGSSVRSPCPPPSGSDPRGIRAAVRPRSEEHTSELQ